MIRLFSAGRIITGLFFMLAGLNKLLNYGSTQTVMSEAGLEPALILLPLTIALELGGGAIIALGRGQKFFIATALALAAFTLATNAVFHRFWEFEDHLRQLELSLFFKNLVVVAALFMIAGHQHSHQTAGQ